MSERARFERELSALGLETGVAHENPIPRARVGDPLGEDILALLWEEIAADDVPGIAHRVRRLEGVLNKVHDEDAGALLQRLEPSGDLGRDFDYRLATATRKRLRDKLRARRKNRIVVLPKTTPQVTRPTQTTPPQPPPVGPTPTPQPKPPSAPRTWRALPGIT